MPDIADATCTGIAALIALQIAFWISGVSFVGRPIAFFFSGI